MLRRILELERFIGDVWGDYDIANFNLKTAILWNDKLIDAHLELGRIYCT